VNISLDIGSSSPQPVPASQPAASAPAPQPASTTKPIADTVKLSQGAQIHALSQQGQSPSQIANSLGVAVSIIDTALSITVAATKTTTVSIPLAK